MNQSYRFDSGMIVLLIANNTILTYDFYIHSWKQGYNTFHRYLIYDLTKLRIALVVIKMINLFEL